MSTAPDSYRGFRFPAATINEAVWLYHCFSLSLRFGREFATTLKRLRLRPGDKWLLDEVFIRIRGKQHYLWRAIDQNSIGLDVQVQSRRSRKAAKRFLHKPLSGLRFTRASS